MYIFLYTFSIKYTKGGKKKTHLKKDLLGRAVHVQFWFGLFQQSNKAYRKLRFACF